MNTADLDRSAENNRKELKDRKEGDRFFAVSGFLAVEFPLLRKLRQRQRAIENNPACIFGRIFHRDKPFG
jgi:hypothetical protein